MCTKGDMQIWEEIQADPEKGAERLVAEYGERLYATAFRICLNETDAEDLVQRTFVQVLRRIGSFKGDSSFVTWMCAILVNFYRMDKRGKARNALVLDETEADERPDTDPNPAESLARRDEAAVLRAAVAHLPAVERETVVLHYFDGLSVPQIARLQGAPEGTVYYRLHEARASIRKFVAKVLGAGGIQPDGKVNAA